MNTVTLSPKFQVVIPKAVRQQQHISVGMKFEVVAYGERIELIPLKPMKYLRGSLRGINKTIVRDKDRL